MGQIFLGEGFLFAKMTGSLWVEPQKALIEIVSFPNGELGVVVDVWCHICDFLLPKLGSAANFLDQLIGELHHADVSLSSDRLHVHFHEVFVIAIGVIIPEVLSQFFQFALEGGRGQYLHRFTEIADNFASFFLVIWFIFAPGLKRLLLGCHYIIQIYTHFN